jgi:hypothetical protein
MNGYYDEDRWDIPTRAEADRDAALDAPRKPGSYRRRRRTPDACPDLLERLEAMVADRQQGERS